MVLVLALEPGALVRADVVVMGRSSPSGNELSGPGRPRGVLGGTAAAQRVHQGSQSGNAAPFRGFRAFPPTVWGNGVLLCPSGGIVGIARGVPAQRARQGSQSGNGALSGVSGPFYSLGQLGASMPLWGGRANRAGSPGAACPPGLSETQCGPFPGFQGFFYGLGQLGASMPLWGGRGNRAGSPGAGRPPWLSETQCGPFPGFQGFFYGLGQLGASMPLWGGRGNRAGSPGAGRPPDVSERQCGPSPGFQDNLYGLGQWGVSMPLWGGRGNCAGSRGGSGGEEDCRVVPAGGFRRLRRRSAWRRRRPWGGLGGRDGGSARRSLRGLGTRFAHGPRSLFPPA